MRLGPERGLMNFLDKKEHNFHRLIELPRETISIFFTGLIPTQIITPIYLDVFLRLKSILFARFVGKNLLLTPTFANPTQ